MLPRHLSYPWHYPQADTSGRTTNAHVQPGSPILSGPDHGLIARNESEEKYYESEPQGALRNGEPLAGDGGWSCKAESIESRSGRDECLGPCADGANSPIQEGEGGHGTQEIHDNQREDVHREEPQEDSMGRLCVPISSESQSSSGIYDSARKPSKEILTVTIH